MTYQDSRTHDEVVCVVDRECAELNRNSSSLGDIEQCAADATCEIVRTRLRGDLLIYSAEDLRKRLMR